MIWQHFMGTGIVEPVDDVRASNPPVNPELLDALSRHLQDDRFDMRKLARDICLSRAYQTDSVTNSSNEMDARNYSHAPVRRMQAEVLLDAIAEVTEMPNKFRGLPIGSRAVEIADGKTSNGFLTTFGRATRESVCTCDVKVDPNLSQALELLNGGEVQRKVDSEAARSSPACSRPTPPTNRSSMISTCAVSPARRPTQSEANWSNS